MDEHSIRFVAEDFFVSPQLKPEDLEDVWDFGIRSVINNRPDGEGGERQPRHVDLQHAAQQLGLNYAFLPVVPNAWTDADLEVMRLLLKELPRPILAFCHTGGRSAAFFREAQMSL